MKSKEPLSEVETKIGNGLIRLNNYGSDGGFIGLFTEEQLERRKKEKKKSKKDEAKKKKTYIK